MSTTIRPETETDRQAIFALTEAAFGRADESHLIDALRAGSSWISNLSWVAEREGRVLAHALATRCHIGDVPALCLAPCAVLPEFQGTGLGTEVIEAVIGAAREQGESYMTVLGHPTYYPRFGFYVDPDVTVPFEVEDGAFMVLQLGEAPMPAGEVRYAAEFGI